MPYSHSQLSTYRACPLKYALKYEHKLVSLQPESRHDADYGAAWDAGLTAWYKDGDSSRALDAFAAAYPRSCYPSTLPVNSQGKTFDNGLQGLADYITRWQEEDAHWTVLHVQEKIVSQDGERTLKLDMVIRDDRDGQVYGVDTKAQPLWSKLLTPNGWVSMGRAYVGMPLFGRDGNTHEVVGIYPQGMKACYQISFSDGSKVHCSSDHLWVVSMQFHDKEITLTLDEIVKRMSKKRAVKRKEGDKRSASYSYKYRVPLNDPIEWPERDLQINPYLLGVLLGDGCLCVNTPQVSIGDLDRDATLANLKECIPSYIELRKCRSANFSWNLTDVASVGKGGRRPNRLMSALAGLELRGRRSGDKFIPPSYLQSSVSQRLHLLQGLLDTDGCCSDGHIYFDSTSPQLATDVVALVRSLGGYAQSRKVKHPEGRVDSNRVSIRPLNNACMFRLERKQRKVRPLSRKEGKYIVKVEMVGIANMQCIRTSAPDGLYITDDFTVTHNTTASYLDGKYWSRYEPNSQVRIYTDHVNDVYGHCGGFIINAASFKHRSRAYTPRTGPDKGTQLPAGDWHSFARMTFNPNANAIRLERDSFNYWVGRIEADKVTNVWGYNDQSCHQYGRECEYYQLCSAGYSWPRDEELVLGNYRQCCPKVLEDGRCQLDWGHGGEHDATLPIVEDYMVEPEDIENAVS